MILTGWLALGVSFFIVVMLYSFAQSYGYSETLNLVDRTPDPQLTWLYLHLGYVLTGVLNILIVLFAFLSLIITRAPWTRSFEAWMFFTGATVFVANFYAFFVLKLIGQEYEGQRGASFLGVGALARVGERGLSGKKTWGFGYLQNSLAMLTTLSQYWPFYSTDLDRVRFTVYRLSQLESPPFAQLEALSKSLTKLPDLSGLPDAFHKFLEDQKWAMGFEPHRIKRSSLGVRYLVTFLVTILGTIVALYPTELRNTLAALGGSIADDPLILLAFFFTGIAIMSGLVMTNYRVALSEIRGYSDRIALVETGTLAAFWVLLLVLGYVENVSVAAAFGPYFGILLIIPLSNLASRRLQRRKKAGRRKTMCRCLIARLA